jgi:hypothetical protein
MGRPFTLYWSSLDKYEKCPQSFLWGRGWGAIDCGGGPGRKKPKPLKKSRHHAVMGIVIAEVLEDLYNHELWKSPEGLSQRLTELTDEKFKLECARNYIDWRIAPSKTEMLTVCTDGVLGFLKTLKQNRLLGPYAKAEVDLVAYVNKYTPIGGRADLIIRRDDTGISILDGKNSKAKGKYTDPDQLRWYALCFYLAYRVMPDRLGFTYFRYPAGMPVLDDDGNETGETETGVDWVEFSRDDLKGLAQRAVDARKGMDKERFPATPTPSNCRFCDYETVCEQRQEQKAKNRRRKKSKDSVLDQASGFVTFGMDGEDSVPVG